MRIAVIGATGTIGSRITKEAVARGHQVTAVQRGLLKPAIPLDQVRHMRGDALDPKSLVGALQGQDAIVCAVSPRNPPGHNTLPRAARSLLAASRETGVRRLVVVGGASSLEVAPGVRLFDSPDFPAAYRAEAKEGIDALEVYRREGHGVDWTFVSPPAIIQPGERKGKYKLGKDQLLTAADGQSHISAEDYAIAIVDILEKGLGKGERVAVCWP
jgi:uncharacterized protein